MINFYDIMYGLGVGVSSPFWLLKPSARHKVLGAFAQRMGKVDERTTVAPAIMIHAVSLGEINAIRALVEKLRATRPEIQLIVSTTTRVGHDRAQQLYGNNRSITVIRYPLDFSGAVSRVLDRLRPSLVVLMELEVWPNFVHQCFNRDIPVMVANGRLTTKSHRRLVKPLVSTMFRRLSRVLVQDETYAARFMDVGVRPEALHVVGTMKFDTATVADRVPGDDVLAAELGVQPGKETVWVCGSTGPGEEEIILTEYRKLLARFHRLRLIIVPRKPERFNEVAELIESFKLTVVRRSRKEPPPGDQPIPPVILGDTMGELRTFYSLADVVFVGRSLVDLGASQHGSDMIEPAALGKPIVIGPYTANFADAMRAFRAADAVLEVTDGDTLYETLAVLISTPEQAIFMGHRAQETVRHIEQILGMLS